eukprot:403341596
MEMIVNEHPAFQRLSKQLSIPDNDKDFNQVILMEPDNERERTDLEKQQNKNLIMSKFQSYFGNNGINRSEQVSPQTTLPNLLEMSTSNPLESKDEELNDSISLLKVSKNSLNQSASFLPTINSAFARNIKQQLAKSQQNKNYSEFLNRMGKDQKMTNQEAYKILGLPTLTQQFEQEQQNDGEDSDIDQFWQPLDKQKETQKKFAVWAKEQTDNPRKLLEEASKDLLNDFEFSQKHNKMFSDPNMPITISQTPVLKCYDALNALQEKGKLFFQMPLKEILEQDKKNFEKIMNKLKRSHQIEIRNLKSQLKTNYLKILNDKLLKIQDSLVQEFGDILKQIQDKDKQIKKHQDNIMHLQNLLRESEQHLAEVVRHQTLVEIDYLSNKLEEQGRKIEKSHTLYQARLGYDAKAVMTQKINYLTKRDPMLNKQFKLYNAYIFLELKEKEKLAGMQILEDFAELLAEKEYFCQLKEQDIKNFQFIISDFQQVEIQKDFIIEGQREKIEKLESELLIEKRTSEAKLKALFEDFELQKIEMNTDFKRLQDFVKIEVDVRETIQEKLISINNECKKEIRKLRLILKTPRLYQQYLKDIGLYANAFITQMQSQKQLESKMRKKPSMKNSKINMQMMNKVGFYRKQTLSLAPPSSGRGNQYSQQSYF